MSGFDEQYTRAQKLMPAARNITRALISTRRMGEAPRDEDLNRNTDLWIVDYHYPTAPRARVAVRIRQPRIYEHAQWRNEFTIRSRVPATAPTELRKVLAGWGDYIFYAFANRDDTALTAWMLGDLNIFRAWHADRTTADGHEPGAETPNGDGTRFRAYSINELPAEFVIGRHAPHLKQLKSVSANVLSGEDALFDDPFDPLDPWGHL